MARSVVSEDVLGGAQVHSETHSYIQERMQDNKEGPIRVWKRETELSVVPHS